MLTEDFKRTYIYLSVLPKEKLYLKENGFMLWDLERFYFSELKDSILWAWGWEKKKSKQMKYFLAWQFFYFTEIVIQVFASESRH